MEIGNFEDFMLFLKIEIEVKNFAHSISEQIQNFLSLTQMKGSVSV